MNDKNESATRDTVSGSHDAYATVIDSAGANPHWRPNYKDAPTLLEAVVLEHQQQLSKAFVRRVFNGLITEERKADAKRKAAEVKALAEAKK
jgi:hypothetical protein